VLKALHLFIPCLFSTLLFAGPIHTEVLVIGGGTSGIAAGIQSARMGAKTLIIEETSWLGGMISSAGVSAFDGNHNIPSGIWRSFREKLHLHYGGADKVSTGWVSNTLFEPHVADSIFKQMASSEKNLKVIYHARFEKLIMEGNKVRGALFLDLSNNTKIEVLAKVVIDATELGDASKSAGIPYDIGLEADSLTGEHIGINSTNDIIQDLTYVAILKDYGLGKDCTIVRLPNYDPSEFDGACSDYYHDKSRVQPTVDAATMLNYGKLPNGKYMINWPKYGNDYYVNMIEMDRNDRDAAIHTAKQQTLRFVYFIQHELGYKHLGLADDEFPTSDRLSLIPYHRESRRIKGLVRYTMRHVADPFVYGDPLYRTGISVGDYPVDHHHKKNKAAPQHLDFYPIPSFNIPLGVLIPASSEGLVVAEKSISVSNVINGATRLQPVVMLIGQAAGTLAALSVKQQKNLRDISIRTVQQTLLDAGAMIMPYIDATPDSAHFKSIQRIGATGILRGEGRPYKWANQTWFHPGNYVDIKALNKNAAEMLAGIDFQHDFLTIADAMELIRESMLVNNKTFLSGHSLNDKQAFGDAFKAVWIKTGLENFELNRNITRLEFAVMLDHTVDPFNGFDVDHTGSIKK
jgi:hypothetical protein